MTPDELLKMANTRKSGEWAAIYVAIVAAASAWEADRKRLAEALGIIRDYMSKSADIAGEVADRLRAWRADNEEVPAATP